MIQANRLPCARPASSHSAVSAGVSALLAGARACAPALPNLHHHLPDEDDNNATRRCSVRLDRTSRGGELRTTAPTRARSPIATRLFDVHLGFRRTSVVIDLTRKAARGDAHQLDSIDIAAILARRRPRTRARWARSLCALLCASVIRALDDGTDRSACFARQVASRQLAPFEPPGRAWTKPRNWN